MWHWLEIVHGRCPLCRHKFPHLTAVRHWSPSYLPHTHPHTHTHTTELISVRWRRRTRATCYVTPIALRTGGRHILLLLIRNCSSRPLLNDIAYSQSLLSPRTVVLETVVTVKATLDMSMMMMMMMMMVVVIRSFIASTKSAYSTLSSVRILESMTAFGWVHHLGM